MARNCQRDISQFHSELSFANWDQKTHKTFHMRFMCIYSTWVCDNRFFPADGLFTCWTTFNIIILIKHAQSSATTQSWPFIISFHYLLWDFSSCTTSNNKRQPSSVIFCGKLMALLDFSYKLFRDASFNVKALNMLQAFIHIMRVSELLIFSAWSFETFSL
jgi:hypothetical protein